MFNIVKIVTILKTDLIPLLLYNRTTGNVVYSIKLKTKLKQQPTTNPPLNTVVILSFVQTTSFNFILLHSTSYKLLVSTLIDPVLWAQNQIKFVGF